jgi:hypothetical protein
MTFWSPRRSIVFLTVWALVTPFKVIYMSARIGFSLFIYAGLWFYQQPGGARYLSAPILLVMYAVLMFPFYAPGLAMAGFVWHGSRDGHFTQLQYYGLIVMLYVLQILLTFILPCPNPKALCVPAPTTALPALFLVSRVVKEPKVPWSGEVSKDQSLASDSRHSV